MPAKRVILEMGTGYVLHGGDYTKAAIRAVEDAIHHSSLTMTRTLEVDTKTMRVDVTIGVQQPERVDAVVVKTALPVGQVSVKAAKGEHYGEQQLGDPHDDVHGRSSGIDPWRGRGAFLHPAVPYRFIAISIND